MRRFAEFAVLVILGAACLWSAYRTVHPSSVPLSPKEVQVPVLVRTSENGVQFWRAPLKPGQTLSQAFQEFKDGHPELKCGAAVRPNSEPFFMVACGDSAIPAQDVTIP